MGPDIVVGVTPDGQIAPGVSKVVEQLLIEQLVAQRPVERFDERVLLRLGGVGAAIYRKVEYGTLPKQKGISERWVGWRESAVEVWLRNPIFYSVEDGRYA